MNIPDEAVEAAARAMSPAVWGPQVWQFTMSGETPTAARTRVQKESLENARRALEVAAPYIKAQAIDAAADDADGLGMEEIPVHSLRFRAECYRNIGANLYRSQP